MRLTLLAAICLLFTTALSAQEDSSAKTVKETPAYLQSPFVPTFSILTADSTWFFSNQLNAKKPTLILYFSPDCGHCQLETEELMSKMHLLEKLQIVMITSRPFQDMKNFVQHYKLDRFPTLVVGSDPAYRITKFYAVRTTPYSALYDKKGKFVREYRKGINMDELIKFLK